MCNDLKMIVEGLSDNDNLLISLGTRLREVLTYSRAILGIRRPVSDMLNTSLMKSESTLKLAGLIPNYSCNNEANAMEEHCYYMKPEYMLSVSPSELTLGMQLANRNSITPIF